MSAVAIVSAFVVAPEGVVFLGALLQLINTSVIISTKYFMKSVLLLPAFFMPKGFKRKKDVFDKCKIEKVK